MSNPPIFGIAPLGFPWQTLDPFLFCVHHLDDYPAGDERMAPAKPLDGRNIGSDFSGKDGWSMYHGDTVPGFPRHPHRGFETVTIARQGYIDHSDSLGATARFGHGDVQWMTAGRGVVHSEMFPLVRRDAPNPTELFQIWLNLPQEDKFADPHFAMLWHESIPVHRFEDDDGRATEVTTIVGPLDGVATSPPPPRSWASRSDADVRIWTLSMEPGARWTLPGGAPDANRVLYPFLGGDVHVAGQRVATKHAVQLDGGADVEIEGGDSPTQWLLLHGRPIGEPVVQHGPFVMNTPHEIRQAMADYHKTGFGAWRWEMDGPVHAADRGRFAIHADGRLDDPSA